MRLILLCLVGVCSAVLVLSLSRPDFFKKEPVSTRENSSHFALPTNSTELPKPVTAPDISHASQSRSEIYRWTDEKGVVHFSDQAPSQGAEVVDLKPIGLVSIPKAERDRIDDNRKREVETYLKEVSQIPRDAVANVPQVSEYVVERTSAEQKKKYVELSGRISGGPKCKRLDLRIYAQSDRGGRVIGQDTVKNAGGKFGSRLFDARPHHYWNGEYPKASWHIAKIRFTCRD